ncbi:hypothetical protein ACFSQ7_10925 [Paenibacillus rhizoplanae]
MFFGFLFFKAVMISFSVRLLLSSRKLTSLSTLSLLSSLKVFIFADQTDEHRRVRVHLDRVYFQLAGQQKGSYGKFKPFLAFGFLELGGVFLAAGFFPFSWRGHGSPFFRSAFVCRKRGPWAVFPYSKDMRACGHW